MSLYDKYRPQSIEEMEGDYSHVLSMVANPNHNPALLFTGASGTGKTTCALALAKYIGCDANNIINMNCASETSVDDIRAVIDRSYTVPLGKAWFFLLDEVHKLSSAAQNALLIPLENCPKTVYYVLCSSEPNKLIEALRNRPSRVAFNPLTTEALMTILSVVVDEEKRNDIESKYLVVIAKNAKGSARQALTDLEGLLSYPVDKLEEFMLSLTGKTVEAIELCRLVFGSNQNWREVASLIKDMKDTYEAEGVRRMLVGYGTSIILKNPEEKFIKKVHFLLENTYDNGWNGLIVSIAKAWKN
jgi:DNA polymerase-3 subunit gamma/tau